MNEEKKLPTDRHTLIGLDGLSVRFSFYKAPITNKTPFKDITLTDAYNAIRGDYFQDITNKVRSVSGDQRRKLKATILPYVTFGGTFKTRNTKDIISLSGLMCFDFDHIDSPETLKATLSGDDNILLMFTSPSGDGLKVVYRDPMEEDDYSSQYDKLKEYFRDKYGLQADSTNDIARACFLCRDPNVWMRPEQEFALDGTPIGPKGYPISWDIPKTTPIERLCAKHLHLKTLIERFDLIQV